MNNQLYKFAVRTFKTYSQQNYVNEIKKRHELLNLQKVFIFAGCHWKLH